jgi:hypothetical protein
MTRWTFIVDSSLRHLPSTLPSSICPPNPPSTFLYCAHPLVHVPMLLHRDFFFYTYQFTSCETSLPFYPLLFYYPFIALHLFTNILKSYSNIFLDSTYSYMRHYLLFMFYSSIYFNVVISILNKILTCEFYFQNPNLKWKVYLIVFA